MFDEKTLAARYGDGAITTLLEQWIERRRRAAPADDAVLAALPSWGREFIEGWLRIMPEYDFNLSRFPLLTPAPAPGFESAICAFCMMIATIAAERREAR